MLSDVTHRRKAIRPGRVRVVVGFPAGGPTDAIAADRGAETSDHLAISSSSKMSAAPGGNTAAGQVARVTPDGYTIMAISTGFVVNPSPLRQMPYDPVKDFVP